MKSLTAALVQSHGGSPASRRPPVRLLKLAPAALLVSGLFAVWAGPAATPVAAAAPTQVVVAWGWNNFGQANVPTGLSGVIAIAAGGSHSLALKSNGTVVAWGNNSDGETTVPAGLSGVTAIAAGWGGHSLALKSDGTVVAWGNDSSGQTDVPAGLSGVSVISAGYFHSLALKSDGTIVGWGSNGYGEATAPAGLSGVTTIAAGYMYSLALKSDGTVVAWGYDGYGQTDVPAGLSGVTAISAGGYHNLALKSNGTVVAWGYDYYHQADVPAGLSGVTAIAAGNGHSLALRSNGTVVAWGNDDEGQTTVPAGLSGVTAIAAGGGHSLALEPSTATTLTVSGIASSYVAGVAHDVTVTAKDADGNVAIGYRGRTHFTSSDRAATLPADYTFTAADNGVHTFSYTLNPALVLKTAGSQSVTAADTVARSITGAQSGIVVTPNAMKTLLVHGIPNPYVAGVAHNVTVTATDAYDNTITGYRGAVHFTSSDPAATLPEDYAFTAADAGVRTFSLGLTLNTAGTHWVRATDTVTETITGVQSGIVVTAEAPPPGVVAAWGKDDAGQTDVPAGLSGVTAIAAGGDFSLALKSNGTVVAWGKDDAGQTNVPAGLSGVTAIAAGFRQGLALKSNGTVVAWGSAPTVPAGLSGVSAIAAGLGHGLALKSDGTVVAWGSDRLGEIAVPYGLSGVTAIAASQENSLALVWDGTVVAWGDNSFGQATVPAGLSGVTAIAAGTYCSLALKSNGTVVAWGYDSCGQATVPAGLSGVTAIAAGWLHSLALKSDGTVVAWGYDGNGQTDVPAGLSGVTAIAAGGWHSLALKPSAAATLAVSGSGSPYVSGVAHDATVTAKDAHGNVATGYRGKVHFTSSDPAAILPADYAFTAADNGVHTFSDTLNPALVLETVGSQSVTATDTVARSITGVQSGIVVTPNPVQSLVICIVSPYIAGAAHSVMVAAKDADGHTYTAYRGTIHFTSTDPAAVLPADYTFTAADAGIHRFVLGLTFKTVGVQGVRARDTVATSITGAHPGIVEG